MRQKLIAITILAVVAIGMLAVRLTTSSAMNGGTYLTAYQERAGIFEIHTYDGSVEQHVCTATVLSSSVNTNRSWLVTAAHCFSYMDDLKYVYGHFAVPRARVIIDLDSDTSGTIEGWTSAVDSTVWRTE